MLWIDRCGASGGDLLGGFLFVCFFANALAVWDEMQRLWPRGVNHDIW